MSAESGIRTTSRFSLLTATAVGLCVTVILQTKGLQYLEYIILGAAAFLFGSLYLFKKRLLSFLLPLLVPFSIPLGFAGAAASVPAEPLLALLLLAFLYWGLFRGQFDKRILTHPVTILLAIDIIWLTVTSFTSSHVGYSIKRVIMRVIFVGGAYLMMSHFFRDPKQIIRYFGLYALVAAIIAVNIVWKHNHYGFNHHFIAYATKPFYSDHTVYSACITVVFLFAATISWNSKKLNLPKQTRVAGWLISLILLGSILHASSRAAWLSLIVVGIFYFAIKTFRIKVSGIILILGIGGIVIFGAQNYIVDKMEQTDAISRDESMATHFESIANVQTDNSNLERLNRWNCALRMFVERPVFGWGPGTYQFEYHQFQSIYEMTWISTRHGDRGNAHSEYLTYLSETGLIGFLIFLGWIFFSIHLGLKLIYNHPTLLGRTIALGLLLGLVSFYIHGGVNAFIDQDKMAVLVFASLGGLVALEADAKNILNCQESGSSPRSSET